MIAIISDLHLHSPDAKNTQAFLKFIQTYRNRLEKLYILGDLFDYWIGDDVLTPIHVLVAKTLQDLHQAQVKIFFMHGNRDFLIGKNFADEAGLTLLPDPTLIDLYGQKALLMHGDTLCLDDKKYQSYREKVRNPLYQARFLRLPAFLRQGLAKALRYRSKRHNRSQATTILDVAPKAVYHAFETYNAPLLIHGHTHRMGVHNLSIQGKACKRIVLGAWHDRGNGLLCCPGANPELVYF